MPTFAGSCLRRLRRGLRTAVGVCAGIVAVAPLARAQTPMGTAIHNAARVSFVDASGTPRTITSDVVEVVVGQLAALNLDPSHTTTADPGATVVFSHILANLGNGPDRIVVDSRSARSRSVRILVDVNGDGRLEAGDTAVTAPLSLEPQDTVHLLVVLTIPTGRAQRGTTDTVSVTATSLVDGTQTDTHLDAVLVRDGGVALTLSKAVDRATATTGDTLTYSITYTATGPDTAAAVVFSDALPDGIALLAGTVRVNGLPLGSGPSGFESAYDSAARRLEIRVASIPGGSTGTLSFQALMGSRALVANAASATYGSPDGPDSAVTAAVQTTLVLPDVRLEKTVAGASTVQVGDTVTYRLRVENRSATVTARDLALTDTLPAGMTFVAARPAAQVDGRVVRWPLASLGGNADARFELDVVVTHPTMDTVRLTNVAAVVGANAAPLAATAAPLTVVNLGGATLSLEKAAGVLEAALGETAPFALTVRNTGLVPLRDLRVHDRLPAALRLVPSSTMGADSTVVGDSGVTFYVAGPLEPGARTVVRYAAAVVSGSRDLLVNTAYATAFAEVARSADAMAFLRVRRGSPMETRAAIGKVWVDENDDGEQQPGESGVAGVEIWSQDGDVATTDAEGRFSFRNLQPGRHAFRLDVGTIAADLRLAADAEADLEIRDGDGWTTPRVVFRLLPRGGRIHAVRVPLPWQFSARLVRSPRPDTTVLDSVACPTAAPAALHAAAPAAPTAPATSVVLRGVNFETARATLLPRSRLVLDRVAMLLRQMPDSRVEIEGHTDAVGSRAGNLRLSLARSRAVTAYLVGRGVPTARLSAAGYGPDRPLTTNGTSAGRALNRRVELSFLSGRPAPSTLAALGSAGSAAPAAPVTCTEARVAHDTTSPLVEYVVRIDNPYDEPLRAVHVQFGQPLDSVVVVRSDTVRDAPIDRLVEVPSVAPRSHAEVTAFSSHPVASATVELRGPDASRERLVAAVAAAPRAVAGAALRIVLDSLPRPEALGADGTAELLVQPRAAGWPDVTLALPQGWQLAADTSSEAPIESASALASGHGAASAVASLPETAPESTLAARGVGGVRGAAVARSAYPPAVGPTPVRDPRGHALLMWRAVDRWTPFPVAVEPVRAVALEDSLRLEPLRTTAERDAERRRAFVAGPAVEIFAPTDGTVFASDRLWIGVRGEAGAPVTLLDGDSVLGEAQLRGDGVQDLINVRLAAGPHRLRVRMRNSWGQTRWDSAAVHVSGLPASFRAADSALALVADGHTVVAVRAQALDTWGVPVAMRPFVTVTAEGATPEAVDADPSSQGLQVRVDGRGWFQVGLRAGRDVGTGTLRLSAGRASTAVPLRLLPAIRPLMVTGVGRFGVGASPEGFGSITARGRLDERTAIVLSYDSRRLAAGRNAFGRNADPLEAAQYPILGDAGQRRVLGASQTAFSARVERGFDWLAAGDILSEGFDRELSLTDYRRAVTGVAGRVTTGAVVWHAFGSATSQTLRQTELRGAGVSGPYQLDRRMRAGTERVVVETRALEDPLRTLARQVLLRDVDYQVDYESGMLLLKRPVPASDTYGNPLFIVVTFETDGGGPTSAVWGLRASVDALRLAGRRALADSVRIGGTWIHDGAQREGFDLTGLDARVLRGRLDLRAEIAFAHSRDSSGAAAAVTGAFRPARWLDVSLRWSSVGAEFRNPSDLSLRPGTRSFALSGHVLTPVADLRLEHEQQWFGTEGVRRERTRGVATRSLAAHLSLEASAVADRAVVGTGAGASQGGEVKLTWNPRPAINLWTEARHQFGESLRARPEFVGAGARVRLWKGIAVEALHRHVLLPGAADYNVTDLGLRSQVLPGTEAWSSYQIAGVDGAHNAALVGLSSRLRLGTNWTASGSFERRSGVGTASLLDPVRALPFLQQEEDYWSAGAGLDLVPAGAPYRASARAEWRDGSLRSTRLFSLAGDLSASRSLALLSRQELLSNAQQLASGAQAGRRLWSLWGLAFRPTATDRLNALVKLEWLDAVNPAGSGVLTNQGHEGRLIGAAEAIWAPSRHVEVGARYAVRRTRASLTGADSVSQDLTSRASFVGARVQIGADQRVGFRAEGRMLVDQLTGSRRFDLAPQLVVAPVTGLEVAAGYRLGDLRDPDFAVSGGNGMFLTFGVRFTERSAASAAAYWRERLTSGRQ